MRPVGSAEDTVAVTDGVEAESLPPSRENTDDDDDREICTRNSITHSRSGTVDGSIICRSYSTLVLASGFVQIVKSCFPGLSRTCKDEIPGFSRTHKTRFRGLSRINSVHKHGCIRSKKCTHQISYRCNCITVTVFLKFKLTQKVTDCTQHFTMNFFSS